MPDNLKAYWKAFFPQTGGSDTPEGEQVNVEGNMLGSWNFALNYYLGQWKFRAYLEHYFEDTSQMFWEYGRWKDGQIGLEITIPKNRWITSAVWEGLCTKDQAGPLLFDSFWGQFPEYQISADDNYYNHYIYGGWQHQGMGMGNPLLPGPAYNADHSISFRSNRVRAHHLGISGQPSPEWGYRMLISFATGVHTTFLLTNSGNNSVRSMRQLIHRNGQKDGVLRLHWDLTEVITWVILQEAC